jgi:hypothetical protein
MLSFCFCVSCNLPEHGFVISPIIKFDPLLDGLKKKKRKKYHSTVRAALTEAAPRIRAAGIQPSISTQASNNTSG